MADWKGKLAAWKRERSRLGATNVSANDRKAPESRTERRAAPTRRPQRYLGLGLDFGTSSTKAVVQLLPTGTAFAVPLGGGSGHGAELYLAPTRLWVSDSGLTAMTANGKGGWTEEMKVRLMECPWAAEPAGIGVDIAARPADLAAAYLAWVLRETFSWVERDVRPKLGSVDIAWSMNLGIPARDYDAQFIHAAFATVARAAWQLAFDGGPLDVVRAANTVDAAREKAFMPKGIAAGMIEVVPEVAAGVATYARSPLRRCGAHLFVDVGATTLDTSLFLLNEKGEGLEYVFLAADVDSDLGALRLHRRRAHELGRLAQERFAASDPLKPIPATARDCIPPARDIDQIDAAFADSCAVKIGGVVAKAKKKAPNDLSVPDSGPPGAVQVLLSGGGIQLPLYQDVVWEVGKRAGPGGKQGLRVRPFQLERIPLPAELRAPGLSTETWHRLAIAYGLSFRFEDIGEFVPPSAVSDLTPTLRRDDVADRFVSKEQV